MINELKIEDGEVMEEKSKTSLYQVLTAGRRESYRKKRLCGYLKRNKMKNPIYFRLLKNESFVGFKRVVTEYLPAAANRWQLDPVDHDENATQRLSRPAMGIATLGREKISSIEQRKVTHPKSKDQTEPIPVPDREGLTD